MRKIKNKNKFEFGTDFQELILQYTVTDYRGFKALQLYEDTYFALVHHATIAYALKKYYKKKKRIPDEILLREFIRTLYTQDSNFSQGILDEDRATISEIIKKIYQGPVKDPEEILHHCINFARYVKFKEQIEKVDINKYDGYDLVINSLKAANNIGSDLTEDYGTFLVKGMTDRAHKRDITNSVNPTPFYQVNQLLNSGGLTKGSVIVLLSKEKRFKTGFLINTARGYLRMKKRGIYIDLENGETAITTRSEQSLSNQSQESITSGDWDDRLLKMFRKYKRLGSELVIKRFPSLHTTTDILQRWVDKLKTETGFVPEFAIVDYGGLMGATTGKTDEFNRISDAFLDLKNFAAHNNLDALWTAAHITREGDKRSSTTYVSTDIAKCIDIPRHVDAVFGLQESPEETEAGVMRLQVVEQRNGMRDGNALFWVDIDKQRLKEFTKPEIKDYRAQAGEEESGKKKKPTRKTDL